MSDDFKLEPKLKARWLEALRSGSYQQGRGALCNSGQFCCLGVLCELLVEDGRAIKRDPTADRVLYSANDADRWGGDYLPDSIFGRKDFRVSVTEAQLARVKVRFPLVNSYKGVSVSNLNDSGFTFSEIADIIEEQL